MNKSILGTASLYAGGSLVTQAIGFFSQIILMRNLTLSDYGYYGLSFEVLILLQMVVGGAFRNFYLQSFRNDKADLNSLTIYQFFNGSLYIAVFSVFLYFLYGVNWLISLSLTVSFVLTSFALPLQTKMLAENRRTILIIKDIVTALLALLTIWLSLKIFRLPVEKVVMVQLLPAVIVAFTYMLLYQKDLFVWLKINKILLYAKLRYEKVLISFIFVFLVNSLHNKLGVLYIKHFSNLSVLALYLAAFKFINPTLFIQTSLVSAYMPKFVSDVNFKFDKKIFFTFFIPGFAIVVFLYLLFPYLISLLGLSHYQNVYPLIKVGSWFILIVFIYGPLSNYIAVIGGQHFILLANIFAFLFYMISACIFGFFFENQRMALSITFCFVIAECIICILYFFYLIKKKIEISFYFFFSSLIVMILCSLTYLQIISLTTFK
ncbi:hypothetical protein [Sodalis sp. dw_96]|uniref:hypothetical protein n=1 Tax=Sodalis sp. dw_96 TaxID=2719794 RepID=UPI001BD53E77|nr:hypothetical protein [Sodalis sp. dw_96]